jgi:hypothetical protein
LKGNCVEACLHGCASQDFGTNLQPSKKDNAILLAGEIDDREKGNKWLKQAGKCRSRKISDGD